MAHDYGSLAGNRSTAPSRILAKMQERVKNLQRR